MSFQQFKKSRSNISAMQSKLAQAGNTSGQRQKDERLWYPDRDSEGNTVCVVRWMPAPDGESAPFIPTRQHAFRGPSGAWYFENCPGLIGNYQDCPVCEDNSRLWATNDPTNQALVRSRTNKGFITNIFVINDKYTPENNGKVFLFKFGKSILDKLMLALSPEFGEDAIDPFNWWKEHGDKGAPGANFRLKIRKVSGQTNYDLSAFDAPSDLSDHTDRDLEEIYNSMYLLQDFMKPEQFKSRAELQESWNRAMGVRKETKEQSIAAPAQPTQQFSPKPERAPEEMPNSRVPETDLHSVEESDEEMTRRIQEMIDKEM